MESLDTRAIHIDSGSATPPFEQVRAHIANLIAQASLPAGTKLPTVRQLASDLGLAVNTAARVYRELESDGLVSTDGRRGTFVRSDITAVGTRSQVADAARAAADSFSETARRLGLTRSEAVKLVEQSWTERQDVEGSATLRRQ